MNKLSRVNTNYLKIVPLIGLLPILLLFFNYISVGSSKEQITGFGIVSAVFKAIAEEGISLTNIYILAIIIIFPVVIFLSSCIALLKPRKNIVYFIIGMYALQIIGFVISLFTLKGMIDASSFLEVKFLIKYLAIGYWATFAMQLLGMILAMKSAKVSPGYIILCVMSAIWLFPILTIVLNSFRGEGGFYIGYFWPKTFTFDNYVKVLTDTSRYYYVKWYFNTLLVATCSCIITSFLVLSTSFILSRIRFRGRKPLMNLLLILGMFPGFMSMIAVYYILKGLGLNQSLISLILVYSAGASLGYYICKGFLDTIPKALDEAASIDGATKWKVFTKIIMPLSKPIIIFTILTSFMGPWADYIFASVILGDNINSYTIAIGLYNMLSRDTIEAWYTCFAAGAVLVSLPIATLFLCLQKYYVEGLSGSVKG